MSKDEIAETRAFWDRTAHDWDIQVGADGDRNRLLNSDPVLWRFAGDVAGLDVLDAGCGTGYLAKKLRERGANVVGIDLSPAMIEIARRNVPGVDFRVDSCSELTTIPATAVDLIVANYVLMDTPDLEGTIEAFCRVLRADGSAVLVFSHPCFPAGRAVATEDSLDYVWRFPYFERRKCVDPPWNHFKDQFIWFHRPLSDYWNAFRASGFDVVEFAEPHLTNDCYELAENEEEIRKLSSRPFSVAFKLVKRQ